MLNLSEFQFTIKSCFVWKAQPIKIKIIIDQYEYIFGSDNKIRANKGTI